MSPYTKRALYAAVASLGTLGTTGAQAVSVSADGRGQVLLYPYYTTRTDASGNAYGTLLSVVNGTGSAKAVRVRFMEGRNSREVMGFNLFLSPFDVWAAAVLPDSATGGARLGTTDLSCTLPPFSVSPTAPFVPFLNSSYSGVNDDGAGTGLDRAKEGYFEIIEMASYGSSSTIGKAITHVNGVPPCNNASNVLNDAQAAIDAQPPSGGLFGAMTLINVGAGTDYTADAVALANFMQVGTNYQLPGAALPDLTQAMPPVSSIQAPDGKLYESSWALGTADPVSAVLMHDSVMNEYVLDSATRSMTDWVLTTPTKRFYTQSGTGSAPKLFQHSFSGASGACDELAEQIGFCNSVTYNMYDREERTIMPASLCFLPLPRPPPQSICWAANIVTFDNSNMGSTNTANINSPFANGWFNLGFATGIPNADPNVHKLINNAATTISGGGRITTGNTVTYVGLPVIGLAVISYTNGTLQVGGQPVLSNYGGNFVHKTSTTIQ